MIVRYSAASCLLSATARRSVSGSRSTIVCGSGVARPGSCASRPAFPARSTACSTTPTRHTWIRASCRSMPRSALAARERTRGCPSTEPSTPRFLARIPNVKPGDVAEPRLRRMPGDADLVGGAGRGRDERGRGRARGRRSGPGSLRTLLAEELLDLGDELGGRREVAWSGRRGRGSSAASRDSSFLM